MNKRIIRILYRSNDNRFNYMPESWFINNEVNMNARIKWLKKKFYYQLFSIKYE